MIAWIKTLDFFFPDSSCLFIGCPCIAKSKMCYGRAKKDGILIQLTEIRFMKDFVRSVLGNVQMAFSSVNSSSGLVLSLDVYCVFVLPEVYVCLPSAFA